MSNRRHETDEGPIPRRLADLPISAPVWVWASFATLIAVLGALSGSFDGAVAVIFAAVFSFQFASYSTWRGLRRGVVICEHDWANRGTTDDPWQECWLCGTTRNLEPTTPPHQEQP